MLVGETVPAVMLAPALENKKKGEMLSPSDIQAVLAGFADGGTIDPVVQAELVLVAKVGLMKGREGGRIARLDNATRAEAIVIIKRLLQYTGGL